MEEVGFVLFCSTDQTRLRMWGDQAGTSLVGCRVQHIGVWSEDTLGRPSSPCFSLHHWSSLR